MKRDLLAELRNNNELANRDLFRLIATLSLPAILAEFTNTAMEYVDASMVGHLGAEAAASVGLVASSTWLFYGLCNALNIGFTVQVAQAIGAGDDQNARGLVRQGLLLSLGVSLFWAVLCIAISGSLPRFLGGAPEIQAGATSYFRVVSASMVICGPLYMSVGCLEASGDIKTSARINILMCFLNVIFNGLLIFPTQTYHPAGISITLPGAGLGILGAALGTMMSDIVGLVLILTALLVRSEKLHIRAAEKLSFNPRQIRTAFRLALPVALQQAILSGAQVMLTRIVSPLGTVAVAANSFSVTAEGFCYMPSFGVGVAASTVIGQSIGARRKDLTKRLAWIVTALGIGIMTVSGILLYIFAPFMIGILTPDPAIKELGVTVLRIEAFAEPLFGASIVVNGVLRGAGDTKVPSFINFCSMWLIRLPLAALFAGTVPVIADFFGGTLPTDLGLRGVWIAMAIELCIRGSLFLIRLARKRWDLVTAL